MKACIPFVFFLSTVCSMKMTLPMNLIHRITAPFAYRNTKIALPNPLPPLLTPSEIDYTRIQEAQTYQYHSLCPRKNNTGDWTRLIHVEENEPALPYLVAIDEAKQRVVVTFRGAINLKMKKLVTWKGFVVPRIQGEVASWVSKDDVDRGNVYGLASGSVRDPGASMSDVDDDKHPNLLNDPIPRVHLGFWYAYNLIRDDLIQKLHHAFLNHPSYSLFVTGYSFGSAPATFLSLDALVLFPRVSRVTITFGGLRVGNRAFVRFVNRKLGFENHLRVTNGKDMLVHLLPPAYGFAHAGKEVHRLSLSNNRNTGRTEVYVACAVDTAFLYREDPRCSLREIRKTVVWEHFDYWQDQLDKLEAKCPADEKWFRTNGRSSPAWMFWRKDVKEHKRVEKDVWRRMDAIWKRGKTMRGALDVLHSLDVPV